MKTDREFIDGIYEKAEYYDASYDLDNLSFLANSSQFQRAKLQMVACLALVLITGIGYSNSNFDINNIDLSQSISDENLDFGGSISMARSVEPFAMNISESLHFNHIEVSDVICTAKVTNIEESVYDEENYIIYTTIHLESVETVKGSINQEFELLVAGAVDELTKVYLDYVADFELNEQVLLFLENSTSNTDLYVLTGESQGKYSLNESNDYVNFMGIAYTLDGLKTHFSMETE